MAENFEKQDLTKVYGEAYAKQWQIDADALGNGNHENAHQAALVSVCSVFIAEHLFTIETVEDIAFNARYGKAFARHDFVDIAMSLSGRLKQMKKRAAAANIRADAAEAKAKQFREGNLALRQKLHEMLARCATALRLASPFLDKIGIGYPGIEGARGAVATSLAEVTRELPAVWSQGAAVIAKHEGHKA